MADTGVLVRPVQRLELDLPPSCIEFCPALPTFFLVGTYNLQKEDSADQATPRHSGEGNSDDSDDSDGPPKQSLTKPQSRNGSIVVFELSNDRVILRQAVSQPSAILDLHFQSSLDNGTICGVVSSTATISLFRLDPGENPAAPLRFLAALRIPDIADDVLFTSFAWHPSVVGLFAVTTSTGEVRLARVNDALDGLVATDSPTILHSLEAWTVAFSPASFAEQEGSEVRTAASRQVLCTVYSGGDDSALRYASCNIGDGDGEDTLALEAPYSPLQVNGHGAGVTAILPLPITDADGAGLVVTGSYDDVIRVYAIKPLHDTCGIRKARLLTELNLGGGVWRLNLVHFVSSRQTQSQSRVEKARAVILASCMHAGARIVEILVDADETCHISILARFEEHRSMNYGSDFVPGSEKGELQCVSTSFYDKLLCLWKFRIT